MIDIVYFSQTGNTSLFVKRLELPAKRLESTVFSMDNPYVLITPTYGGRCEGYLCSILKEFLLHNKNLVLLRGVIGSGDRSFGKTFCLTSKLISQRYHIPLLYTYELCGTDTDVKTVKGLVSKWKVK